MSMPRTSLAKHLRSRRLLSLKAKSTTAKATSFKTPAAALAILLLASSAQVQADSMSALISQKSAQPEELSVPSARISTSSSIRRATPVPARITSATHTSITDSNSGDNSKAVHIAASILQQKPSTFTANTPYQYPEVKRQAPAVLPAFLSANYDNVDSEYLPLLSTAETQSSRAAREVISMARTMALNERTIIQGGCWDYLNAVFKRAGVTRDTIHKGTYAQGPYANSQEIEAGDWLYYINHGYNGVEHSGLFVGWVDESAKQALILSYAGESRREPARYKVYDLSNVYQVMRPVV